MYTFQFVRFSTQMFNFHKELNEFTAEISTLSRGSQQPVFGRIYNDAADAGFILVSQWTGEEVKFCIEREEKDDEGDMVAWHLKPVAEAIRKNPKLKNITVVVFND